MHDNGRGENYFPSLSTTVASWTALVALMALRTWISLRQRCWCCVPRIAVYNKLWMNSGSSPLAAFRMETLMMDLNQVSVQWLPEDGLQCGEAVGSEQQHE